ncbi:MAG: hypothetical protein SNJ84_07220, partial [Verrucomicrobiia bacterium]
FGKKVNIAFICSANLCRSQMAHAICLARCAELSLPINVFSAGLLDYTGQYLVENAWLVCCKNGTPPAKSTSTFIRDLPIAQMDRFLVMEHRHQAILQEDYRMAPGIIGLLGAYDVNNKDHEIKDPIGRAPIEFEKCYSRLSLCVNNMLAEYQRRHPDKAMLRVATRIMPQS